MSIPSKVTGGGNNSQAQNVLRVVFSQALSSIPSLEAWDDSTFGTTTKEMFTGTPVNGTKPYLSGIATTDAAPASAAWKPSVVPGGAVANRLQGRTSYVNLSVAVPSGGQSVRFNLDWELPSDMTIPSISTCNGIIIARYSYSGTAPQLTWQFNDFSAGGTEGSPVWTTVTPGSAGAVIRGTDAGATSASLGFTKPTTGVADASEVWVTNT